MNLSKITYNSILFAEVFLHPIKIAEWIHVSKTLRLTHISKIELLLTSGRIRDPSPRTKRLGLNRNLDKCWNFLNFFRILHTDFLNIESGFLDWISWNPTKSFGTRKNFCILSGLEFDFWAMMEYVLYTSMYIALNTLILSLLGALFSNDVGNTDKRSVIGRHPKQPITERLSVFPIPML